jgi:tRNA A37 threonylcarbamoyladenosine modification protein TsaB
MKPTLLALSMTSSQALMALFNEAATECLAMVQWNNLGGTELAESLEDKFAALMVQAPGVKIAKVFGVEGPGSFTGLRVSSAFLKGIATALRIPLVGIPSYELYAENFAFSLRPAKAIKMTLEECVAKEFKFLEVYPDKVEISERPQCKKVVGLIDDPLWPSLDELQRGVQNCLAKNSFNLNYGYTPEFVTL